MGVHRHDHVAAAVHVLQHAVGGGAVGHDPHGRYAAGIDFLVRDAVGFGGHLGEHRRREGALLLQRRWLSRRELPALAELILHGFSVRTGHGVSFPIPEVGST